MMNRDIEFNNILDECLDRLIFKDETPEQCLNDFPEYAGELGPLLEAAVMTGRVSGLEPQPDFRTRARQEFFAVLKEAGEKRQRSFFRAGWQRTLVSATACILIVLIAAGCTGAVSLNSMPDDFLYPVKRATEQVQLAFTFTSLGRAEAYARMANNRVEEIIHMADENDTEGIELLAASLDSNLDGIVRNASAREKSMILTESAASEGKAVITATASVQEKSRQTAESPAPTTEEERDEGVPEGTVTADDMDTVTVEAIKPEVNVEIPPTRITVAPSSSANTPHETGGTPREQLNAVVTNQANSNISRLRQLLEIVPESVRPAIERAIRISEQGYNIAIDSLR